MKRMTTEQRRVAAYLAEEGDAASVGSKLGPDDSLRDQLRALGYMQ